MHRGIRELEENVGYGYGGYYLTNDRINFLACIYRGDLDGLIQLTAKGVEFGHYQEIKGRLAILKGHVHVLKYLESTNQAGNINYAIAQCASLETLHKIFNAGINCKDLTQHIQDRESGKKPQITYTDMEALPPMS